MDVINEGTLSQTHVIHKTRVDFTKRMPQDVIHIVQYDKSLPILKVDLYLNGSSYTLPASASVYIRWGKIDHTFVYKEVLGKSEDGKSVYVEIDDQMTYFFGNPAPILELKIGSNSAGSSPINISIDRNPIQNGDVESHSEYPDLEHAVEIAQEAAETAEEAAAQVTVLTEQVETNRLDIAQLKEEVELNELTYSELVTLRNSGELHTNAYYLITDYITTTNGKVNNVAGASRSAGHQFDLLVKAISESELSEEANALIHSGDTYFANSDLSAWKIWYCLDNNTNRFEWADTVNGKGVIYRMIDEFGNDLPYDFKNIQFKRYKITSTTDSRQSSLVGMYLGFEGVYGCVCDTSDFVWRYTFTKRSDDSELSYVASNNTSYTNSYFVKQVKIGQYLTDTPNYRGKQALNNIVFLTSNIVCDIQIGVNSFNNTLVGNTDITYSYYGEMFRKNIIIGEQSHNRIAECMQNNLLGDGTLSTTVAWNRAGDHFENNIGISFSSNNFETNAKNTRFASIFTHNNVDIVIDSCDFSNLDEMSHCNIGTMIDCTISGYWYTACEFIVLSDITCDINAAINCTFNRAQYISYTQGSSTINTMNLTFDAMIGNSASDMLIIDLSGAPNIASQFNKRVGWDKGDPTGKVLTYTYEKVNTSTLNVECCKYAIINSVWTQLSQPYYTKTETDAKYVDLTSSQTISGSKTFTNNTFWNFGDSDIVEFNKYEYRFSHDTSFVSMQDGYYKTHCQKAENNPDDYVEQYVNGPNLYVRTEITNNGKTSYDDMSNTQRDIRIMNNNGHDRMYLANRYAAFYDEYEDDNWTSNSEIGINGGKPYIGWQTEPKNRNYPRLKTFINFFDRGINLYTENQRTSNSSDIELNQDYIELTVTNEDDSDNYAKTTHNLSYIENSLEFDDGDSSASSLIRINGISFSWDKYNGTYSTVNINDSGINLNVNSNSLSISSSTNKLTYNSNEIIDTANASTELFMTDAEMDTLISEVFN